MKQPITHPGDIVVVLQLAIKRAKSLTELGVASGRSVGEVHNAIRRLRVAGLMEPDGRGVDRESVLQFIRWGVPVAYPAVIRGDTIGTGTARISQSSAESLTSSDEFEYVWPNPDGRSAGSALVPLHSRVPEIVTNNPRLYAALAAVDLIRVGGTRERNAGAERLRQLIGDPVANG